MTQGVNLKLDGDEDYLRRFVPFPDGNILAYGGDDGTLVNLTTGKDKTSPKIVSVRIIRQYDEGAIRALAVSSDGNRVAVGFDNGSTRIYRYDDYNVADHRHPFIPPPKGGLDNMDHAEDDDDNGYLSQPDRDNDEDDTAATWAGPQMETAVRDLKFLPDSHWVAIASESTSGLCVVNVSSVDTMKHRYLETQVENEHNGCGIRGVDVTSDKLQLMASLALDGRLCVWKVGGIDLLKSVGDNVPFVREAQCCVPLIDIGESNGSSPSDRSCSPHWVKPGILVLPGKIELQLRRVSYVNDTLKLDDSKQLPNSHPSKGHVEPIAALTSQGDLVVSSGRDGRVVLWQLQENGDDVPTVQVVRTLGQYESVPTSMYWKDSTLYIFCANGSLQIVTDLKTRAKSNTQETSRKKATNEKHVSNSVCKTFSNASKASAPPGRDENHTDEESMNECMNSGNHSKVTFVGSEEEEDSDNESSDTPAKAHKAVISNDSSMLHANEDDWRGTETKSPPGRSVLETLEQDFSTQSKPTRSPTDVSSKTKLLKKSKLQTTVEKSMDVCEDDNTVSTSSSSHAELSYTKKIKHQPKDLMVSDDGNTHLKSIPPSAKSASAENPTLQVNDVDDREDEGIPSTWAKSPSKNIHEPQRLELNVELDGRKASKCHPLKLDADSDDDAIVKNSRQEDSDTIKGESKAGQLEAYEAMNVPVMKGNAKLLVKQSSLTKDDDDDIFNEEDEGKERKHKETSTKASFSEVEDSNDLDDGDDDVIEVEGELPKQDATNAISEVNWNTATSPTIGKRGDGNSEDGYPMRGDDEDSSADDIAAINEVFKPYRGAGGPPSGPEPQAAFAPSSTPLKLARRFLCWNSVGSITLINDEMGHRSTVDINFTDKAFRRPISFTDNMGFILGSLGDDGAIFATDLAHDEDDLDENEDVMGSLSPSAQAKASLIKIRSKRQRKGLPGQALGSSVYFHRFDTFASLKDKDWYLTLPDRERVLGCGCGQGWAAVVTSRNFIRFFTTGGAQGQILWLPGNPVTLVGRERYLAVFYQKSPPLQDGTQKLGYILYDVAAASAVSKGPVCCISVGSCLSWAGFSNDLSLVAMDSDGMLSMLIATSWPDFAEGAESQANSWEWSPLLDTASLRKSSEDSFWPISVYDGKLVCVPLKGGTQYPDAVRRPITASVGMKMPLARGTLAKCSTLEELSIRSNLALIQKKVNRNSLMGDNFEEEYRTMCAQVDKVTLKLFATVMEAGKLERALDLVDRLHLEKSHEIAMAIAENHTKLVDFIEEAKENKFRQRRFEDYEDANQDEEDHEEPIHTIDMNSSTLHASSPQVSKTISPEPNQAWKSSKRSHECQDERSVRARTS